LAATHTVMRFWAGSQVLKKSSGWRRTRGF